MPIRCVPNGVFSSRRPGTAVRVTSLVPRRTTKFSGVPAEAWTIRCISAQLPISASLMDTIRSPFSNPARAPASLARTSLTRGVRTSRPKLKKMNVKMTMARMKLATGPATTTAARFHTF